MEQAPDLLEQERDHGRGPVLARLSALLERGCRLELRTNDSPDVGSSSSTGAAGIPLWAETMVDVCLRLDSLRRPSFSRVLEDLEAAAPAEGHAGSAEGHGGVDGVGVNHTRETGL